jgi:hypothetical protein
MSDYFCSKVLACASAINHGFLFFTIASSCGGSRDRTDGGIGLQAIDEGVGRCCLAAGGC